MTLNIFEHSGLKIHYWEGSLEFTPEQIQKLFESIITEPYFHTKLNKIFENFEPSDVPFSLANVSTKSIDALVTAGYLGFSEISHLSPRDISILPGIGSKFFHEIIVSYLGVLKSRKHLTEKQLEASQGEFPLDLYSPIVETLAHLGSNFSQIEYEMLKVKVAYSHSLLFENVEESSEFSKILANNYYVVQACRKNAALSGLFESVMSDRYVLTYDEMIEEFPWLKCAMKLFDGAISILDLLVGADYIMKYDGYVYLFSTLSKHDFKTFRWIATSNHVENPRKSLATMSAKVSEKVIEFMEAIHNQRFQDLRSSDEEELALLAGADKWMLGAANAVNISDEFAE